MHVPSWVPGAGWKKKAAVWAQEDHDLFSTMREAARVRLIISIYFMQPLSKSTFIVSGKRHKTDVVHL